MPSINPISLKINIQDIEVFIDPIIVILTFILGFVIANWQLKKKEKVELNSAFYFFDLALKKQRNAYIKQVTYFKEYSATIKELKPFNVPRLILIIQNHEILDSVNKPQLIQSFKQKKNRS